MKRGHKPNLPATKRARGTYRPDRDGGVVELVEPESLPQRPDSLTEAGQLVWLDNIGRAAANRLATERDSTIFGQFCNLVGALNLAWSAGEVPPIVAITEAVAWPSCLAWPASRAGWRRALPTEEHPIRSPGMAGGRMTEPHGPEHQEIAEHILGGAFERLIKAGLGHVEACHALVQQGIDLLPAFCCKDCLPPEYEAMLDAIEDRLEDIPNRGPGEIAQPCPGHMH